MRLAVLCSRESWYLKDLRRAAGDRHETAHADFRLLHADLGPKGACFHEGKLDLGSDSFDLTGCLRTLHHVPRPELVVAELTRVTRPGGQLLVVDQIAPVDPLAAVELNRFEHARDPSTTRILADVDLRGLFDSNNLVLQRTRVETESRDMESYLDLAACEGEERERARALAPSGYAATLGWYLLRKPGF